MFPTPLRGWQPAIAEPEPVPVTSGPGFGKMASVPSGTVQPLPRLATKRSGRSLNATAGACRFVEPPPVTVTAAQFM